MYEIVMKCTDVEPLLLGVAAILAFGVKHAVSSQGRGKKQKAQRLHTGDYPVLGELLGICVFGWLASFVCLHRGHWHPASHSSTWRIPGCSRSDGDKLSDPRTVSLTYQAVLASRRHR